jgi:hypothetical protein
LFPYWETECYRTERGTYAIRELTESEVCEFLGIYFYFDDESEDDDENDDDEIEDQDDEFDNDENKATNMKDKKNKKY